MDSLDDIVRGFETGADDYLVKPFQLPELVARIKALLRRRHVGRSERMVAMAGNTTVDLAHHRVVINGQPMDNLTYKEMELLFILLAPQPQGGPPHVPSAAALGTPGQPGSGRAYPASETETGAESGRADSHGSRTGIQICPDALLAGNHSSPPPPTGGLRDRRLIFISFAVSEQVLISSTR